MHKINIAVFSFVLAMFCLLSFLPADPLAKEAEALVEMPELSLQNLADKSFVEDYESYLSSNMALRSYMLTATRVFEDMQGIKPSLGLIEKTDKYLLFTDRIMEVFRRKPEVEADYAASLGRIAEAVHSGVNVYSMLVPTQAEFLSAEYKDLSESQRETIDHVNSLLPDGIIPIDAYVALQKHADEYIYFRTDHHWTALGAHYAYEVYCEAAGLEPVPLNAFNELSAGGFLGYLYNQKPSKNLEENSDTIYYYTLDTPVYDELIFGPSDPPVYSLFLGWDRGYMSVTTEIANGRTAVVIKDSYANCFVPFLAASYERIVVIDPRYAEEGFSLITELENYEDADLLFLNYTLSSTFNDIVAVINDIK